jgi:uncharacterized membrane protein
MIKKPDFEILDAMTRDPGNWRGPFYANRKDPRMLVPKLYPSLGWTLNFGSPFAYGALAAILIIIAVAAWIYPG